MAISTTNVECSRSPSLISPNIKQENRSDDRAKMEKTSIAFSITNILSNNFGNNNKVISEKNSSVCQPCDNHNEYGESSPKKVKFNFDDEDSDGEFMFWKKKFLLLFCLLEFRSDPQIYLVG